MSDNGSWAIQLPAKWSAGRTVTSPKWFCYPGAIFPDVLSMYDSSPTLKHLLFVPPFLWEDDLQVVEFEEKKVAWLLAVPISEEERVFAEREGSEKLEDLFVERQIDIFNIERASEV